MRFHRKHFVGIAIVLAMAVPVLAGLSSRTESTAYNAMHTVMVGKTQLQPGHYKFEARESGKHLEIRENGRMLASVPCTWIRLSHKPAYSEVISKGNRVVEVDFQGRTKALKVS